MEDAETEVGRSRERPRGRLRMSVGVGFGVHQLVPALPRFEERYPEVEVDLHVEDRVEDAAREALDIVVRPGTLIDESLVAKPLFEFERILCAAPAYLKRHGMPRTPQDLLQHNCIAISSRPPFARWSFDTPAGREIVDVRGGVTVNNADCVFRLGMAGLGIVRLNEFIVAEALARRQLVRVLPELQTSEKVKMLAMYPQQRQRLPRVAAMLEFLSETFGPRPWRTR
jgi:DNA-binding transcriptional LysR family regulator